MSRVTCLAWGCAAALLSCDAGLPVYSHLEDLRVLCMQAEPPEQLMSTATALQARVTPVVVDPRGGALKYAYALCPVQSAAACLDFQDIIAALPAPVQQKLNQLRAITQQGTVPAAVPGPDGALLYPIPPFDLNQASIALYGENITSFLFDFFAAENFLDLLGGAWPSVQLTVTSIHGDTVQASKRLVVGLADWAAAQQVLPQFGLQSCNVAPGPQCLPLGLKVANTNPILADILVQHAADAPDTFTSSRDPGALDVRAGEQLVLRPLFADAAPQSYVVLRADLQTRRIVPQTVVEDYSVSWFCEAGKFASALTWPHFTRTQDNIYTAPKGPAGSAPINLYVVARDNRGGTAWRSLQLHIVSQ